MLTAAAAAVAGFRTVSGISSGSADFVELGEIVPAPPDDASSLLQRTIGKDKSAPDEASIREVHPCFDEGIDPSIRHKGIVVENDEIFSPGVLCACIAGPEITQVFRIPKRPQVGDFGKRPVLRDGRVVIHHDYLEARFIFSSRNRSQAGKRERELAIYRDDDGDIGTIHGRQLDLNF